MCVRQAARGGIVDLFPFTYFVWFWFKRLLVNDLTAIHCLETKDIRPTLSHRVAKVPPECK